MSLVFFSEAVIKDNCLIDLNLANSSHKEISALYIVLLYKASWSGRPYTRLTRNRKTS